MDSNGDPVREPGSLKAVKGIGWYIEEYGIAQLSLNLTDIRTTPVHTAFDEACRCSQNRGIRVTGSELVGLLPLRVLTDAADFYLRKQQRSLGISDAEKVKIAVKSLGLDDLAPFHPQERVIEYIISEQGAAPLLEMNLRDFARETASESPAPGGGSIAAYSGALGTSLATMVANLSAHKRGWDHRWEEFSDIAVQGMRIQTRLLDLVDADTAAFNGIMNAYGMPKASDNQKRERLLSIQEATRHATEVPLEVARVSLSAMELAEKMADFGNPNSITDAGVGAMAIRAGVMGAILNARVNAKDLEDEQYVAEANKACDTMWAEVVSRETAVLNRVNAVLRS
jgi:glutamate formiminotransferase/formiminotetrahydrofolate cyclodeaminase